MKRGRGGSKLEGDRKNRGRKRVEKRKGRKGGKVGKLSPLEVTV